MTAIKSAIICIICLFIIGCDKGSFKNNKMSEKQKLSEPLSLWLIIDRVNGGQVIRPMPGYQWKGLNGHQVFLNSNGLLQVLKDGEEMTSSGDLGSAYIEKNHTYLIDRFNDKLEKYFNVKYTGRDTYHLRIFSLEGFAYDLSVYSENNEVNYIMVCRDYCNDDEVDPELIIISKLSE